MKEQPQNFSSIAKYFNETQAPDDLFGDLAGAKARIHVATFDADDPGVMQNGWEALHLVDKVMRHLNKMPLDNNNGFRGEPLPVSETPLEDLALACMNIRRMERSGLLNSNLSKDLNDAMDMIYGVMAKMEPAAANENGKANNRPSTAAPGLKK